MFKTLYGKIAVGLLLVFVCIGLLYLVQTLTTTKLYLQEVNQRLNRNLADYLVQERYYLKDGEADILALKSTFERLMHINPNIELYLLDVRGRILAYSASPGKVVRDSVDLKPLEDFIESAANFPILGDDPRDPERKKVFSAATILAQDRVEGYLYVILGGEEYDSVANRLRSSYVLRLSIWIAGAGLLLVFAVALVLFNLMTRRVRRLAGALDEFRKGDFQTPIDIPRHKKGSAGDEIDRLRNVASQMSDRIIAHLNTIKRVDSLRREMVSNISHDLRTPLSSLQGYLETLLMKSHSLSAEEREAYLKTALSQSHRLGNLISELYELAKLDSPDMKIHAEAFNMGELAQDILQKYQLKAREKEVSLEISAPRELPPVHADIALIERAIQNLIDNALSFSRNGGNIRLIIEPDDRTLTIKVMDDGYGIRKEDIPFIFDRFYQGKGQRREDDDSTGLGLAITKRILELHHSPIEVQSEPEKGATFMFALPLHASGG